MKFGGCDGQNQGTGNVSDTGIKQKKEEISKTNMTTKQEYENTLKAIYVFVLSLFYNKIFK